MYADHTPYLPPISTSSMMYAPISNAELPPTVRVKQELPDVSTDFPCQYAGRHAHERDTVIKQSHPPSLLSVKSELSEKPCCSATVSECTRHSTSSTSTSGDAHPSHLPLHLLPGALPSNPSCGYSHLPSLVKMDAVMPPVINGLSFHSAPVPTEGEHTRRVSYLLPIIVVITQTLKR